MFMTDVEDISSTVTVRSAMTKSPAVTSITTLLLPAVSLVGVTTPSGDISTRLLPAPIVYSTLVSNSLSPFEKIASVTTMACC